MTWEWIDLEGAHNARDLGGLVTARGMTRPGVLMRSDALDELTAADVHLLHSTRGLAHVIDLRAASERTARGRGPLGDTAVRYTELEMIGEEDLQRRRETRRAEFLADRPPAEIMAAGYVELLRLGASAFVEAFEQIVAPGGTPVLLHCAAGKDRTGVLIAVLLDVAEVERDTIVEDYAASNERMAPIVDRLGAAASYEQIDGPFPPFVFEAVAETMARFLAHVDEEWHGAAGYLSAMGVPDDHLTQWRELFVAS